MFLVFRRIACCAIVLAPIVLAQQPTSKPTTAAEAPNRDTSYIDANGTAHVTRVVPVPQTISPEAQKSLSRQEPDEGPPQPLEQRRKMTDAYTAGARIQWTKICPNTIVEQKMAGVPVRIVTPEGTPESNNDKVLLNLHGGGFNSDSGSYTESIPIASYTKIKVVAVLYRLSPEVKFPAAVDDSIAVYKELLKTYEPGRELDDYGAAVLRYQNGGLGTVTASQISHGRENDIWIEVDGTKASLEWRQEDPNKLWLRQNGQPRLY